MDIKELSNDGLTIRLAFHFVKEDYAEMKKKELNKFRRNAEIRGFRKGMAPMSLIERMHGGEALVHCINELISNNLNKYIEDNKLSVIGEPLPVEEENKNNFEDSEEFDFTFDIALAPKFEMNITEEDKIPYYTVSITEKEKTDYKNALYKQFAKLENCEEASAEDFIIAELTQGEKKVENTYISLSVLSEDAKKLFVGKKAGEELDVNVNEVFPNEPDRAALLKMKKEELAGMEPVWHLVVKEVKHYVDAKPGQELYDQLFGKDKVKTDEEFEEAIVERMKNEFKQECEYRFMLDTREYLIEKANISVSEDFMKRWLLAANEGKVSKEDIEKDFPLFIKDFKWQSIAGKIITDNKLEIKKENLIEEARKVAQYQFAMYGMTQVPEEQLAKFAEMMLNDEKQARRLYEKAEEDVVLDYVRKTATLEKKRISSAKLRKMND